MNLNLISKHRNSLFGVSIIGIIIFHFCESYINAATDGLISTNIIVSSYYHVIGSTGVEIFLFLSGMGLYYSYSKNRKLSSFYKKRFGRVLTCYIPIGLVFWILSDFVFSGEGILDFLKDFTLFSFWIDGKSTVWFIALILVLYAIFPIIFNILYPKNRGANFVNFLLMIIVIVIATVLLNITASGWYKNVEIAITRIPIFCFGCYMGEFIAQRKQIGKRSVWFIIILGLVARCLTKVFDVPTILSRYAATMWAIALLLILCWCIEKLSGTILNRGLQVIGGYSLELYLSHVMIRSLMNTAGHPAYVLLNYIIIILISIIISIAVHKLVDLISKKIYISD